MYPNDKNRYKTLNLHVLPSLCVQHYVFIKYLPQDTSTSESEAELPQLPPATRKSRGRGRHADGERGRGRVRGRGQSREQLTVAIRRSLRRVGAPK